MRSENADADERVHMDVELVGVVTREDREAAARSAATSLEDDAESCSGCDRSDGPSAAAEVQAAPPTSTPPRARGQVPGPLHGAPAVRAGHRRGRRRRTSSPTTSTSHLRPKTSSSNAFAFSRPTPASSKSSSRSTTSSTSSPTAPFPPKGDPPPVPPAAPPPPATRRKISCRIRFRNLGPSASSSWTS